jgi:hypothetical protein
MYEKMLVTAMIVGNCGVHEYRDKSSSCLSIRFSCTILSILMQIWR